MLRNTISKRRDWENILGKYLRITRHFSHPEHSYFIIIFNSFDFKAYIFYEGIHVLNLFSCTWSDLMTSADVMFYNGPAISIAPSLWIKARLTTKPLIWKSFFLSLCRTEEIFRTKILHLASFSKWEVLNLRNGLFSPKSKQCCVAEKDDDNFP